jgi:hypothetical protein
MNNNKTALKTFETVTDVPDGYIELAWQAFTVKLDKERGLWYAWNAQKYFKSPQGIMHLKSNEELNVWAYKRDTGMHVIAMQYLWNNWFTEAFEIDFFFLGPYYRQNTPELVEQYIEMLIIKRQQLRLQQLFNDKDFKTAFINHYDVYYSLLVNANHHYTNGLNFTVLVNKVNKLCVGYGEPAFL